MTDRCPRDLAGFCRVALLGHPDCVRAAGCRVSDPQAAYDQAYDRAIARIYRDWRRQQGRRR